MVVLGARLKLVSGPPLRPLHQFLPLGSYLEFLPYSPSVMEYDLGVVSQVNLCSQVSGLPQQQEHKLEHTPPFHQAMLPNRAPEQWVTSATIPSPPAPPHFALPAPLPSSVALSASHGTPPGSAAPHAGPEPAGCAHCPRFLFLG